MTSASSSIVSPASTPVRRPSQATATSGRRQPERRARMAAHGDVRVELRRAALKPSSSAIGIEDDRPVGDEQRPGLQEVAVGPLAARRRARTIAPPSPSLTTHARRGGRRARAAARGARPAGDPDLAERPVGSRRKKPPTTASCDAAATAPDVQPPRRREEARTRTRVRRSGWRTAYTVVVSPSSSDCRQSRYSIVRSPNRSPHWCRVTRSTSRTYRTRRAPSWNPVVSQCWRCGTSRASSSPARSSRWLGVAGSRLPRWQRPAVRPRNPPR